MIGRRCRHVPRARAHEVIAGYLVVNDVTVRDWQLRIPTWTMGKSFDTHGPIGPWLTTADEVGDPHGLRLRTWVNGELRQDSNTKQLIFDCFALVEHLSTAFTLEPGDVIATGTPGGVGIAMKPPRLLAVGDVVRVEIEGLGALENRWSPSPSTALSREEEPDVAAPPALRSRSACPTPEPVRAFYRDFGLAETRARPLRERRRRRAAPDRAGAAPRACSRSRSASTTPTTSAARPPRSRASASPRSAASARCEALRAGDRRARARSRCEPRLAQKPAPPLALQRPRPHAARRTRARRRCSPSAARAPRKLSHVVLGSPDAAASRRFFVEGIGFRVSDEVPAIGASFLRCSTDHHNLLVQAGPVPVPAPHRLGDGRRRRGRPRRGGAWSRADPSRHVWGLGRHGIGSNFFWYLRDPAGNFAEYTSDLDVIADEEAWKVAASSAAHPLAAWGPPVPRSFLAPDDIVALARGEPEPRVVDVAIVGYGPVGQVLAILLGQRGWRVQRGRALARALPAAARRALRPRGGAHPPGRGRRRARSPGAPMPAPIYEWRNARGETLIRFGRDTRAQPLGLARVEHVLPAGARADPRRARARAARASRSSAAPRRSACAPRRTASRSRRGARAASTRRAARALRGRLRRREQLRARRDRLGLARSRLPVRLARGRRAAAAIRALEQPAQLAALRSGASDHARLGRPRPPALGVHAAPARDARRAERRGGGLAAARALGRAPGQREARAPRGLHASARAGPIAGAAAARCSPATPRT